MRPNDFMVYGDEGILYRDHLKELAGQGIPSSEMPSFREWQESKLNEHANREEARPEKPKYGAIKFIGLGIVVYFAFQAYSCLSDFRYLNKSKYSAPYNPDKNQPLEDMPLVADDEKVSEDGTLEPMSLDEKEMNDRMDEGLKKALKTTGVGREMERGTSEERLYRKWKEEREREDKETEGSE